MEEPKEAARGGGGGVYLLLSASGFCAAGPLESVYICNPMLDSRDQNRHDRRRIVAILPRLQHYMFWRIVLADCFGGLFSVFSVFSVSSVSSRCQSRREDR